MRHALSLGALWAVVGSFVAPAPAQVQFEEISTISAPISTMPTTGTAAAVALVDLNGNGALDMVVGKPNGRNRLYLNDTTGYLIDFTSSLLPDDSDLTQSVAAGDFDGDGDLDLFFGNAPLLTGSGGQNKIYLNNGRGQFVDATAASLPVGAQRTTAVAIGDVDGDGDNDIVCGNSRYLGAGAPTQQNRLYINDGSGVFADVTATQLPADSDDTLSIVLGDLDGDGDLDIVCGNSDLNGAGTDNQNRVYRNDGAGSFVDVTTAAIPLNAQDTVAVALADVDGNGALDIVCGNSDFSGSTAAQRQNRLYLNDGSGSFTDETATRLPVDVACTEAIRIDDVDSDGDLDIVTGNSDVFVLGCPRQDTLSLNDGTGVFQDATMQMVRQNVDTMTVGVGDLDGDGAPDLVAGFADLTGSGTEHAVFLNDRSGTFSSQPARSTRTDYRWPRVNIQTRGLTLGDVDGDGDLDGLVANHGQNFLRINDGTGTLSDATATGLPADSEQSRDVALGDIDGDGDLDAVIANNGQSFLYTNDGAGTFSDVTATQMPAFTVESNSASLGDIDGDGDLDLLLGNGRLPPGGGAEPNLLYVNDGNGNFTDVTATQLPATSEQTREVLLVDVDGDGDLDVIAANNNQNTLLVNDGSGVFSDVTATQMPSDVDGTTSIAVGDVDGDGDVDLVFGNGWNRDWINKLYLNDGSGTFSLGPVLPGVLQTRGVGLVDFDEDGDLDLYAANFEPDQLFENDGAGNFADVSASRIVGNQPRAYAVAIGDIDADGDADVVVGTWDANIALTNHHRQISQPVYPAIGQPYELKYHAKPGYGSADHTAAAVLGTGLAPAPIDIGALGTFFLDPTVLFALPPVPIPQTTGEGMQQFPIPAAVQLVGLPVYIQALIINDVDPSDARLTGYLDATIGV